MRSPGASSPEGGATPLERARALLREAARVVVLTGAGVSAESGVPTFRGPEALWKRDRPDTLATPEAFARDPRLVWEWYEMRRQRVAACAPNAAHRAIARMIRERNGARVITQNVDGLHLRAAEEQAGGAGGVDARERPLELHGSLFRARCTGCSCRSRLAAVDASEEARLPRCTECGALLRPDVVWFGEALEAQVVEEAFHSAGSADLCVVVGTSAVVHPAASLPLATLRAGGRVLEINPERTPLSSLCAITLQGPAGELFPALLAPGRGPGARD